MFSVEAADLGQVLRGLVLAIWRQAKLPISIACGCLCVVVKSLDDEHARLTPQKSNIFADQSCKVESCVSQFSIWPEYSATYIKERSSQTGFRPREVYSYLYMKAKECSSPRTHYLLSTCTGVLKNVLHKTNPIRLLPIIILNCICIYN